MERVLESDLGSKAHENNTSCFRSSFYPSLFHQLSSREAHFQFFRDHLLHIFRRVGGGRSNNPGFILSVIWQKRKAEMAVRRREG